MAKTDTIINVPVADIVETDNNEYIFGIDDNDVQRLAEEINDHGFIGSIDVVDLHNGKYQVFAGHQRLRAVKSLGWETVPCTVADDMPEEELYRKLLASNVLNRKISPLGYARAIDAYKKEVLAKEKPAGRTRTLCAKFFNVAEGQVQRYEAILKTTPYVQEMCRTGELPYAPLAEASGFTEEQQQELERQIKSFQKRNPNISISMNLLSGMISSIKEAQQRAEAGDEVRKAQATLAKRLAQQEKKEQEEEKKAAIQRYFESGRLDDSMPVPSDLPLFPEEEPQPQVARTPNFTGGEMSRLSMASSVAGNPLPAFEGYGADELDDDEEEAVPNWEGITTKEPTGTDYAVIDAINAFVSLVYKDTEVTNTDEIRAAIQRAEDALNALKVKLG